MLTSIAPPSPARASVPAGTRKQPHEEAERLPLSLEDETTTWVFPDQLPLPFIYEDRMPRYAAEGLLLRRDMNLDSFNDDRPHAPQAATICDGGSTLSFGGRSDDGPRS